MYANGRELMTFFCFFLFTKRRSCLPSPLTSFQPSQSPLMSLRAPGKTNAMNAADMLADISHDHAELTAVRRDIHAHPEMGLEEVRTAALVAAKLREWGIEVTEGVGVTAVVGVIRGTRPVGRSNRERAIGLRAWRGVSA